VDKVYMPSITRFQDPRNFYGVWAHELAHNAELRIMPRRSAEPVALRLDRRGVSA
jgi:antirestriction protein ArdC